MKNVIIIGAGPAGLTAGIELLRQSFDYKVTILEKDSCAGGISKTVQYKENFMDLGGHRFFSKNDKVIQWWKDIMKPKNLPVRDRVSHIYYNGHYIDYPVSINTDTLKALGPVTSVSAGLSFIYSQLHKCDISSLEDFYIKRFGRKMYDIFFKDYTEKVWGQTPDKLSADWGAQRVRRLSLKSAVKTKTNRQNHTSLTDRFYYPDYGPGQLWNSAADTFLSLGGKIIYNANVTDIDFSTPSLASVTYTDRQTTDCKTIYSDIVISSMPLKDLGNAIEDKLPDNLKHISRNLPYRDFITAGVLISKDYMINKNINDCWIYIQDKNLKLGRLQIFNNWSDSLVKEPDKYIWLGMEYFCNENDDFWNMKISEKTDFIYNELLKTGLFKPTLRMADYHFEYVLKAYPSYSGSYKELPLLTDYLKSIDNLYCIGRNGQHRYNNMDHSMLTAFETVSYILGKSYDKSEIWNINTDDEYHES